MPASLEKRYENLYTCPHYVICTLLSAARFKDVFFTDKESAHKILEEAYSLHCLLLTQEQAQRKLLLCFEFKVKVSTIND